MRAVLERFDWENDIWYFKVWLNEYTWRPIAISTEEAQLSKLADEVFVDTADVQTRAEFLAREKAKAPQ